LREVGFFVRFGGTILKPVIIMKKLGIFIILNLIINLAYSQTTDDLLNSYFAKKYILIRVNPNSRADNQNLYQIDGDKTKNIEYKGYDGKLNISVSTRGSNTGELGVLVDYLNPFKYMVRFSDSTYSDPSFANMAKFTNSLVGLTNMVTKQPTSSTPSKDIEAISTKSVDSYNGGNLKEKNVQTGFIYNDLILSKVDALIKELDDLKKVPKKILSDTEKLKKEKLELSIKILNFRSPDFTEWKYLYQKDIEDSDLGKSKYPCLNDDIKNNKSLFDKISEVDTIVFDGNQDAEGSFLNILKLSIEKMRNADNLRDFDKNYREVFKPNINKLRNYNDNVSVSLVLLANELKKTFYDENKPLCVAWGGYTKTVVSNFYTTSNNLIIERKKVIQELDSLSKFIENVLQVNGGSRNKIVEETILARSKISQKDMKNLTVFIKERNITFNNGIEIKEGKVISKTDITLSSYKTFITEFSPSLFFTNTDYQIFGTKIENGLTKVVVEEGNKTNYSFAANFNFVYNPAKGKGVGVNPMFQIGVGVTKDRPSLLLGGGVRFSKDVFISLGAMFSWKKELDKLKVGDSIESSAVLEKDFIYNFNQKPYFYLGIGYNLKKL
jgi:hypothetical protein